MQFHEYRTFYQERMAHGFPKDCTPRDFYRAMFMDNDYADGASDDPEGRMAYIVGRDEWLWYKAGCWYYKVWPGVAEAMMRVKLDRPGPDFRFGDAALMLRFGKGAEVGEPGRLKIKTALVTHHLDVLSVVVEYDTPGRVEPFKVVSIPTDIPLRPLGEVLEDRGLVPCMLTRIGEENGLDQTMILNNSDALRLAVAVLLMRNDPTFVQPDRWDEKAKFDADGILKDRVERAATRGVREWRIGEQYESVPHLRRPHLGLRWTGEGRTVPKIVPVKGSVVHRSKATQVPTGHYDEQGKEVE